MGLVILLVVAIIGYILVRGAGRALTPGFLTNPYNDDVAPGILYQLWELVLHAARDARHLGAHLAFGAAIYLVEYAPDNRTTSAAKTAIETLSSLPSNSVVGMFGSLFFVVTLGWGISILAGACTPSRCSTSRSVVRTIQQALEDVPCAAEPATPPSRWASRAGRPPVDVLLPADDARHRHRNRALGRAPPAARLPR